MIEESPERYPVIRGHLRRLLLQRFPYAIYYKFFSNDDQCCGCDPRASTPGRLIWRYHVVDCNHPVVEIASRLVISSCYDL
ncbi:MAG: hypothetical protein H0X47_08655 [Nitrospirales bacterium]|nr:hypothetical protein [Nitrospirales bacterium]